MVFFKDDENVTKVFNDERGEFLPSILILVLSCVCCQDCEASMSLFSNLRLEMSSAKRGRALSLSVITAVGVC